MNFLSTNDDITTSDHHQLIFTRDYTAACTTSPQNAMLDEQSHLQRRLQENGLLWLNGQRRLRSKRLRRSR